MIGFRWALLVVLLFAAGFAVIGQNSTRAPQLTAAPLAVKSAVASEEGEAIWARLQHEQRRAVVVDKRFTRSMERLEARLRVK